jgi:hypothetical protein
MTQQEADQAIRSCERLAVAAYSLMDQGRYAETADLFAENAVWVRGGTPVRGRSAILAALERRSASEVTRHLVTNVMVSMSGPDAGEGTACFVPLRGTVVPDAPAPLPQLSMVGDLRYEFVRTADGWRIAHLRPSPVFKA